MTKKHHSKSEIRRVESLYNIQICNRCKNDHLKCTCDKNPYIKTTGEPQSQQRIIGFEAAKLYWKGSADGEVWIRKDSVDDLLHQQRELTIRECLQVVEKIPTSDSTVYGLMMAEQALQSLLNQNE